jgi:hypothetical protein
VFAAIRVIHTVLRKDRHVAHVSRILSEVAQLGPRLEIPKDQILLPGNRQCALPIRQDRNDFLKLRAIKLARYDPALEHVSEVILCTYADDTGDMTREEWLQCLAAAAASGLAIRKGALAWRRR